MESAIGNLRKYEPLEMTTIGHLILVAIVASIESLRDLPVYITYVYVYIKH